MLLKNASAFLDGKFRTADITIQNGKIIDIKKYYPDKKQISEHTNINQKFCLDKKMISDPINTNLKFDPDGRQTFDYINVNQKFCPSEQLTLEPVNKHQKLNLSNESFDNINANVKSGSNELPAVYSESDGQIFDCTGKMVWPGLFDIHTHGCLGYDFSESNPTQILEMCLFYAKHGITSILATAMTNEDNQLAQAMEHIRQTIKIQTAKHPDGAKIQGIHLEGPFFGTEKKGAHDEKYLRPVSQKLIDQYQSFSGGAIRLLDLDPSLPGAMDFIQNNKERFTISIAHTGCSYETAKAAAKAGASHVTHLFNAMNPLLHREPGVIGAAFELGLNAEIISDGIHIHPAVIQLMFSAMPERIILISDSINPTGLSDGYYTAGGLPIEVKDGRAYLSDGTLAGSTITLFDAVKNAVRFHIPLEQALSAATILPAKAVGLADKIGSISCGQAADLLIVDTELNLEHVMIEGNWIS